MKIRYVFVALVLTTGCSAILGLKDGKMSPGLEGDPCELFNSPSTPCSAGLGCFGYTCYGLCPADGPCPSGTRCMITDGPTNGGGIESNPRVCVPFDKARCNGQNGGNNSSGPICSNGGIEQCWNGECRTGCQIQQPGQTTGPTNGVGQSCHAGETCVAQNPNGNQGFCYAPSELGDAGTPAGNTGTDLVTFGGNMDGPIAVTGINVYYARDSSIWLCAKTGCSNSAANVSSTNMTARFLTTFNASQVAWAFSPTGGGQSGIQRCGESGPSCTVKAGLVPGAPIWELQGLDQRLYWITINAQNIGLGLLDGTMSDSTAQTVGTFTPPSGLPNQLTIGYHPISPEQHLVEVSGQMFAVIAKSPTFQATAVTNDQTLFNFQGAPLITHGASRAVWVVETNEKSLLFQCQLDTDPSHGQVCLGQMGALYDYKSLGAKVTALGSGSNMIVWSEWVNNTTSTIRACSPQPGAYSSTDACAGRVVTVEANLPGKVSSLVADSDGYVYYMLVYNSANQKNGVNYALRRVKGP